jgi:hypothetical protein
MFLQKKEIIKKLLLKLFHFQIGCTSLLCLILLLIFSFLRIMPLRKYLTFGKLTLTIGFFARHEKN